jgi:hypothetical protein
MVQCASVTVYSRTDGSNPVKEENETNEQNVLRMKQEEMCFFETKEEIRAIKTTEYLSWSLREVFYWSLNNWEFDFQLRWLMVE